ncbi:MAG TPA: ABC transporter permease [Saprospiraceae bacterium]|nr:ABC transporter permease [Saprospiraceae bacterium]
MTSFVLKKALLIIPSLVALSVIVFFLSKIAPGDQVQMFMAVRGSQTDRLSYHQQQKVYSEVYEELGLNKALFYISIKPAYFPDTLYKVIPASKKNVMKAWLRHDQDWEWIQLVFENHEALIGAADFFNDPELAFILTQIKTIHATADLQKARQLAIDLKNSTENNAVNVPHKTRELLSNYFINFLHDQKKTQRITSVFPTLHWHGLNNQYHQWLSKAIRLDFGISLTDGQPVSKKISMAFIWTLSYVIFAYLLSLFLAISLGLYTAYHQNKWQDKLISTSGFVLYAVPLFWLGTLAIVFLTTDIYGKWLHIFPDIGVGSAYESMIWIEKLGEGLPHLILPALLLGMHGAASAIRLVRNTAIVELKADYIVTARAKGISESRMVFRHLLPNTLLPITTALIGGFPGALAGSVVIEVIFNIPGMGRLLFDSIRQMDWPVVFAMVMLLGVFTFIIYLLGDILYARINPKIKYQSA